MSQSIRGSLFSVLTLYLGVVVGNKIDPHLLDEPFPGWQGETFVPAEAHGKVVVKQTWVEQISESPRAYVYHNFVTDEEANHLIRKAGMQMLRSKVAPKDKHGRGVVDNIRTSYGTFLHRYSDPVIGTIEDRVAKYVGLPVSHQESIQVLRYTQGQEYQAHHDGFDRYITMVIFLCDVEEGGETIFPYGKWIDPKMASSMDDATACGRGKLGMKPKKGDAVVFYDKFDDGTNDPASTHTACPVLKGVKWSAPIWIHAEPFRPNELNNTQYLQQHVEDPGFCKDSHGTCAAWARTGECDRNPTFMNVNCRMSCVICTVCEEGDHECYLANRERAGFLNLFQELESLTGTSEV